MDSTTIYDNDDDSIHMSTNLETELYIKVVDAGEGYYSRFTHVQLNGESLDKFFDFLREKFPKQFSKQEQASGTPAAILNGANRIFSLERVGGVSTFNLHHVDTGVTVVYDQFGCVTITKESN